MFRIWIGNLGKYNEGELVGEWVDLPCDDFDAVFERIGINERYEETFIADYENDYGLTVGEWDDIEELNELADELENMPEQPEIIEAILDYYSDPDDGMDVIRRGDYRVWSECDDIGDVVRQFYEETGQLAEIEKVLPEWAVDWEALGRDWEIEGTFLYYTNHHGDYGYIEIIA